MEKREHHPSKNGQQGTMKWSWKLIRIAGIDVYVHATFVILIVWIGLSYWQMEGSLTAVISRHWFYPGTIHLCRTA